MIAHDSKKQDMLRLIRSYQQKISGMDLVATKGTGLLIHGWLGLPVTLVNSGSEGGDEEIAALVARGQVWAVIFLREPLTAQTHEPDVSALLRICDVHNVPLATNPATAKAVLNFIFQQHYAKPELALV